MMILVFPPQDLAAYLTTLPNKSRAGFSPQCLPDRMQAAVMVLTAATHASPRTSAMLAHIKSDRSRYECGVGSSKSPAQRTRSLYLDFAGEAAEVAGIAAGRYLARMEASRISTTLSGSRFQTSSCPKIEIPT